MSSAKRTQWCATALSIAVGLFLTIVLLVLVSASATSALAAPLNTMVIRYVVVTGTDSANNCNSSGTPCRTVQHGLDTAQAGDEIWVAAGVYTSAGGTVADITQTVTLQGGWDSAFSQNNPVSNVTTLDGRGLQPVVVISPTAPSVGAQISPTIEGFVVTDGRGSNTDCGNFVSGPGDDQCGGGVASLNADPLIVNNVISNNVGANFTFGLGGGIYLFNASAAAVISGNLVISNIANIGGTGLGGGILEHSSLALIQGNKIWRNIDDGLVGKGNGGGIKLFFSHASIIGNDIRENTSSDRGGGIHASDNHGTLVISDNNILSNTAVVAAGGIQVNGVAALIVSNTIAYNRALSSTVGRGGGIRISTDTAGVTITHNDLYSNVAGWGGGSAIDLVAPGVVDANSLHQNKNGQWGAALVLTGTALPVTATNNVIADNLGAGLEAGDFGTTAWVVNNTVVGGRAISGSADTGILVTFDTAPSTPVTATIVNNLVVSGAGCGIDLHNPPAVIGHYNDVWSNGTDYCGGASNAGNIRVDPAFVNAAAGDFHLSWASPLVNAGSNPEAPATDRDGVTRPQGLAVDIGAYELVINNQLFVPVVQR